MDIAREVTAGAPLDDLDHLFKFSPESPGTISEQLQLGSEDKQSEWITRLTPQTVTNSNKKLKTSENMKTENKLEKSRQSARECRAR